MCAVSGTLVVTYAQLGGSRLLLFFLLHLLFDLFEVTKANQNEEAALLQHILNAFKSCQKTSRGFCLVLHEDLPQLLSRAGASTAAPCLQGAADGLQALRGAVEDFATEPLPPVEVEEIRLFAAWKWRAIDSMRWSQ